MTGYRLLDDLLRDTRYALRLLRKEPGFATTAILTLALGIGVNTAVFSVVDFILLRPLPYPEPETLAMVSRYSAERGTTFGTSQDGITWETVRDNATSFDAAVYSGWTSGVNVVTDAGAAHVQQQRVGAGYFGILGVRPAMGREFSVEQALPEGPPVAILSHHLWQQGFGGAPDAIGEPITLRGEPYTVVGVMPGDFRSSAEADLWTPLRANTDREGSGTNYQILARRHAGTTDAEATAELGAMAGAVNERYDDSRRAIGLELVGLQEAATANVRRPIRLLWAAVATVLLIACVNLSGLLLVRADRRRREIATRMAIGGGHGAVIRQLMVESVVLALLGGLAGLVVAQATLAGLTRIGASVLGVWQPVNLDGRVLAATAALSLGSALVFGLAPSVLAGRVDLHVSLRGGAGRGIAGSSARLPRRALLIGQVALAVVLLVAAGLLMRTLLQLRGLEAGFDPTNLYTANVSFEDARYDTRQEVNETLEEGLSRVRALPGVDSATAALGLPYQRLLNLGFRVIEGDLGLERTITNVSYVTPDFFETLRIAVLRGRPLGRRDTPESAPAIVINDTFASTYLTDGLTVGRHLFVAGQEREIVGVVASPQQTPGFDRNAPLQPTPTIYLPLTQTSDEFLQLVHTWFSPAWIVRLTDGRPAELGQIRGALESVDALLPLAATASMEEVLAQTLSSQRLLAMLVAAMAAVAVFLAALGIHGLVASSVHERTRELGIRMALGATVANALRAVAVPGIVLSAIGGLLGGLLALWATRGLQSFLWGVTAGDPTTWAAAALLLLAVAAVASVIPALRVLRLDPASSLRAE